MRLLAGGNIFSHVIVRQADVLYRNSAQAFNNFRERIRNTAPCLRCNVTTNGAEFRHTLCSFERMGLG